MTEVVLILAVDINLYAAQSLKDKRQIARSLMERLRHRYGISLAETRAQDKHQRMGLTIAYVALHEKAAREMAGKLCRSIDELLDAQGAGERHATDPNLV